MSQVDQAIEQLRQGELVGMPTETVYGLAGSILSEKALRSIFSRKERPFFDPLIVHIADLGQKEGVVREWPPVAALLAQEFWPGPLTLVLPKNPALSSLITSGLDTVAIRMPSHPIALELIRGLGHPVAAPSANKFGKTSPTTAEHVRASFPGLLVLEGGLAQVGLESTVVRIDHDALTVLRPGGITEEALAHFVRRHGLDLRVERAESNASPGHTEHHYMPEVPLVIVETRSQTEEPNWNQVQARICTALGLRPVAVGEELLLSDDPLMAARELYANMRETAGRKPEFLYVWRRPFHHGGLWAAIWDRLERAASKRIGL